MITGGLPIDRAGRAGGAESGQASVELVALLPVGVAVVLAAVAVMGAGSAGRAAESAAQAGALAALQDRDPANAARAALAGWPKRLWSVRVLGPRVTVSVRPRLPEPTVARWLTATATADAGEAPRDREPAEARGGDGLASGPPSRPTAELWR